MVLYRFFLSVNRGSGQYPEKLTEAMKNYEEAAAFYRKCGFRDYRGTTVLHISELPD